MICMLFYRNARLRATLLPVSARYMLYAPHVRQPMLLQRFKSDVGKVKSASESGNSGNSESASASVSASASESKSTGRDNSITPSTATNSTPSSPSATTTSSNSTTTVTAKKPRRTLKQFVRDVPGMAQHFWDYLKNGSILLVRETWISLKLMHKLLQGKPLIRREKRQLRRTFMDLFRLIPFSIFLIVPLLELTLPFVLKVFPNLMPSTFEDKQEAEANRKRHLKTKLEVAKFLQETVEEMALDPGNKQREVADSFRRLFHKFRVTGEPVATEELIRVCQQFGDTLTLENLSRPQLVHMCRYMGLRAYGTDNFLRFGIRNRMAHLKTDDKMIVAEGVESLTIQELQHACQSRGIRFMGVSPARMKIELQQWLDLHVRHKIPSVLLILSRAYTIESSEGGETASSDALRATIAALPETLVNQVQAKSTYKQRLAVLEEQEELIADELEQEERARQDGQDGQDEQDEKKQQGEAASVLSEAEKERLKETLRSATEPGREDLEALKKEREELQGEQIVESNVARRLDASVAQLITKLESEFAKSSNASEDAEDTKKEKIRVSEDGRVELESVLAQIAEESIRAKVRKLDADGDGVVFLEQVLDLVREDKTKKAEK